MTKAQNQVTPYYLIILRNEDLFHHDILSPDNYIAKLSEEYFKY